jgi:hypothetical protein
MVGTDTARFCCTCSRDVYDLTAMHPDEAESFLAHHLVHPRFAGTPQLAQNGELPCGRIYRRADGRVLTSECPTGEDRRRVKRAAATLAIGLATCAVAGAGFEVATRPVLAPDDDPPDRYTLEAPVWPEPFVAMAMGTMSLKDEDDYDVGAALRSDEPTSGDLEPEGEGPARRRYVRPDPSGGIIRGTIRLVRPRNDS